MNDHNHARFRIVESTHEHLLIEDVGPWDEHLTITNDAEWVVYKLALAVGPRRLEYIDSEGNRDQLLIRDGKFAGFAPARRPHPSEQK